jgi:hypothetical protein
MINDIKVRGKFQEWWLENYDEQKTVREFIDLEFDFQQGVFLRFLREEYQVVLCVYTNASGFLWSVSNVGGTDLGWSGRSGGDCEYSGAWTSYETAFKNAFGLITQMSFNEYHKCKDFTHCGCYANYLKEIKKKK